MKTDQTANGNAASSGIGDTQALFNKQLAAYRKIVGENLMFHREVYGLLHDVLCEQMPMPFKFLDIACGDRFACAPSPPALRRRVQLSARAPEPVRRLSQGNEPQRWTPRRLSARIATIVSDEPIDVPGRNTNILEHAVVSPEQPAFP